jgi:hypothetical protein
MGGKVKVTSEQHKGSTFTIELIAMCKVPTVYGVQQDNLFAKQQHSSVAADAAVQDNKPRMLLVNDDPFLLFGYK